MNYSSLIVVILRLKPQAKKKPIQTFHCDTVWCLCEVYIMQLYPNTSASSIISFPSYFRKVTDCKHTKGG